MNKPLQWATNLFKNAKGSVTDTSPKPSPEAMKEVIETALDFDKLVVMPGWERACKFMVTEVNREIAEATQYKYEPDRMKYHVIAWNAKREIIDGLAAYIDSMQRSRDEIVEQYRRTDGQHADSNAGV